MRIHSREQMVNEAKGKASLALLEALDKYPDLTNGEYVKVVNQVAYELIASWAKYQIREERHGDPDKEGGLE